MIKGKVALVTGASKGIGQAIANYFAAAGAKVIVSSRKQEAVDAVASEIDDCYITFMQIGFKSVQQL